MTLFVLVVFGAAVFAQENDNPRSQAEKLMNEAKDALGEILSPVSYGEGVRYFQQAEKESSGKSRDSAVKYYKAAENAFYRALENIKLAGTNLKDAIRAREDALTSNAPALRKEAWDKAEDAMNEAAKTLEDGNVMSAQNKSHKAESLYREAELSSISGGYLDGLRNKIEEAKSKDLDKWAPATVALAESLSAQIERRLAQNRHDDEVAGLAKKAMSEMEHARILAVTVQTADKNKQTLESILLQAEKPLQTIAASLGREVRFDGTDKPTDSIIQTVEALKKRIQDLEAENKRQSDRLAELTESQTRKDAELEQLRAKEENLDQIISLQRQNEEKFAKVEHLFKPQEAEVLKQGDAIVIRIAGTIFAQGKTNLESKSFGLLARVIDAIKEYPDATIRVEGHTDSRGLADANLKLSEERASAVREYITAAGIDPSSVTSKGFGKDRPIAANDTDEGRQKNRRIEILINPARQ
jgi:outer membrane protein OmpA-like peptidoglycan-associated protein